MGLSIYNLKRWFLMLTGKSIYHVEQGLGKAIDKGGYYNDMTQKVLMGDANLDADGIPFLVHSDGSHVQMPTMIFQYGLGAYDLWLMEGKQVYLDKAIRCGQWAMQNQKQDGSWDTFSYYYPDYPYSAMPQGEGISLFLRLYQQLDNEQYLYAAKRAADFMLKDVEVGGVTVYKKDGLILKEYVHKPVVLNGWIFASWGLYDLSRYYQDYKHSFDQTICTMLSVLDQYDNGYWSLYDEAGLITSPFYHKLHIAQMEALYMMTGNAVFDEYAKMWKKYQKSFIRSKLAFIQKAVQKIKE